MSKIQMENFHNSSISIYLKFLYQEREHLFDELKELKNKQNKKYKWLSKDQIEQIKNITAKYIDTIKILLEINENKIKLNRSQLIIC